MIKRIALVMILIFIVCVSWYEVRIHYEDPVMVVNNLPDFPVASDFTLHPTQTNIVRMHVINVSQPTDVLISRARRAVVERKNGVIYFDGKYKTTILEQTKERLKSIGFKIGIPRPFTMPKYISTLSGVFLIVFSGLFIDRRFFFLIFVPILDLWFNASIYLAYPIAFVTPTIFLPKDRKDYFKSFTFIIIAGILIHFLLFQTKYVTGAFYPRAIKSILIVPFIFLIWKEKIRFQKKDMKIILLLIVLGIIYIVKSGNYIEPTILERRIRDWMDGIFYVRPRFKELLIGFPLLWISVKYSVKNKFIIMLSLLGYISVFDSFFHPYTDAVLSAYRSTLSLLIGIFIGEVYYRIYKSIKRFENG